MINKTKFKYLIGIVIFISTIFTSCKNKVKEGRVTILERKVLVNEIPYLIKGICYHPVPKGSEIRNFDNLKADLSLMVEAGINTIRVYSPIDDISVLDEIDAAGLKIIIGFGYNQEGNYDILSGSFINYVNKYKNHKSILFWELGNEFNYHPEWFKDDIENWYSAMDNAAILIHQNDTNHPVSTAHGELPDSLALKLSPNIDVWGLNVYRWDNPGRIFSEWEAISSKPMYLSEAGTDSYMTIAKNGYEQGVNENVQAFATKNILNSVMNNTGICSGVTLFSFTDGWWKAGDPNIQNPGGWAPNSSGVPYDGTPNEEYWGIVDLERNKKKVFGVVKEKFTTNSNEK